MTQLETQDLGLSELLAEHEKLLTKLRRWRSATVKYRWLNIFLFMSAKLIVPFGTLIVAINMISIAKGTALLSSDISAGIAVIVTLFASLEVMLNPGAKKRLAFTLYNELDSLENRMNLARISFDAVEIKEALVDADNEMKKLLNHYSENGY